MLLRTAITCKTFYLKVKLIQEENVTLHFCHIAFVKHIIHINLQEYTIFSSKAGKIYLPLYLKKRLTDQCWTGHMP